jgi:DNA-binding transcriptional LysR family regulator
MSDLLACFRTFCRVVERGSLSRAAADLGLAQATVSRHIQDLEKHYSNILLARSTRRLQVTAAGQQVYEYARSVLRSESELAERLLEGKIASGGRIVIAGPSGFGHEILNPFIVKFIARHPDIRPRLLLSERSVNLIDEGIDVAVRIGPQEDSSLVIRPLGELSESLVVAPALLQKRTPLKHPRDLSRLPRIALAMPSTRQLILQSRSETYVEPTEAAYEVDSSLAMRDALLAGAGYGQIHTYLVAGALRTGKLVQLLPAWALPAWPVNALYAYRARPSRVDVFIEELIARLHELSEFGIKAPPAFGG